LRSIGLFKLAFVELRHNSLRLFVYSLSISIGIAAIFATGSLKNDLITQIDKETKELVGGDLVVKGFSAINDSLYDEVLDQSTAVAHEKSFASMVVFANKENTRLVNVRAISADYPLIGSIEDRAGDSRAINTQGGLVSINESLGIQYGLELGDSLFIGNSVFKVAAFHSKAPGQSGIAATVAPSVFISLDDLSGTGLARIGSRIRHSYYFLYADEETTKNKFKALEKAVIDDGLRLENLESGRKRLGRSYKNLFLFLNLAAFIALIIGGVGAGSAIDLFFSEKKKTVAVLKCVGFRYKEIATLFLVQILFLGLFGSGLGVAIGLGIQQALPGMFKGVFVVDFVQQFHFSVFLISMLMGVLVSVLFGLKTLIPLLNSTPLMALRSSLVNQQGYQRINLIIRSIQLASLILITWYLTGKFFIALGFTFGLLLIMLCLWGLAMLLRKFARKIVTRLRSFELRYAVNALYRPQNQTVLLISIIGLSAILVLHLFFIRSSLVNSIQLLDNDHRPNLIIFDIDEESVEPIASFLESRNVSVFDPLSIVPMRIHRLKGRSVFSWKKDSTHSIPSHVFNREYRVTEREVLGENESIEEGKWKGNYEGSGIIPISIEENFSGQSELSLGDTVEFNVFGSILKAEIASIRKVDFTQMQAAFTIVFPKGSLEGAPVMYAVSAHVKDKEKMMKVQNELMDNFKNISIIDLDQIFESVAELGSKIEIAIQFMFSFSALTALIVLINTLYVSRFQRLKESAVLKTLGAVSNRLTRINIYEFLILGVLAVVAGLVFSFVVSYLLMTFLFKVPFSPDIFSAGIILLFVLAVVTFMGVVNSSSLRNVSPIRLIRGNG